MESLEGQVESEKNELPSDFRQVLKELLATGTNGQRRKIVAPAATHALPHAYLFNAPRFPDEGLLVFWQEPLMRGMSRNRVLLEPHWSPEDCDWREKVQRLREQLKFELNENHLRGL